LRQHILRLEARMRELASGSPGLPLDELWRRGEKSLLADCDDGEAEWLGNSIATARFALHAKGLVVDCDARLPARLITHAWQRLGHGRGEMPSNIAKLIIKLRNFLKVDELKLERARSPRQLQAAVGKRHADLFDFERLAELLDEAPPQNVLPAARKRRARDALHVLESQRFFALATDQNTHRFVFDSLAGALKAYEQRLEEMSAVVKAVAIAELELGNAYVEDKHDSYFERFSTQSLTSEDIAQFPSYLVCLNESECTSRDLARLIEIVTCDLPIKVLIHVGDPLGAPSPVDGLPHRGSFAQQLAGTFVAGNAFVMQSPAANLFRQREDIRKGIEYAGPAIISTYVPAPDDSPALPPYLLAAAALESRVFPAFSYDPAAGEGIANRFDISHNPQVEKDWPVREFSYEDEELQVVREDLSFTLADFAVLQPAYSDHFAVAARESWSDDLVDVAECIGAADTRNIDRVPNIAVVDCDNVLQRLVVDEKLIRIARRCRNRWQALQELGGVHSSFAVTESPSTPENVAPVAPSEAASDAEPAPVADVTDVPSESIDDPYIETPRCTTCDECTKRNDRMFAYDDNRQAYIKDPDAGTYRELVEAAEMCQVAIIHPGKPRNSDEPGLDELIRRAAPFNA
jgi:hypothetical protein